MKVLLVNKFLYPKGGDAISTLATGGLLEKNGHKVIFWGMAHPLNPEYPYQDYFVSHVDFNHPMSTLQQFKASLRILYSFEAKKKIERLIKIEKPDLVHLNNFAHQISPSILKVFRKYKIPTVMTLRDGKLVCPSYGMICNGRPCEKCKGRRYYWCFFKKCTKGSYAKSLINAIEAYIHHNILHLYDLIDVFISPSTFLKNKVQEMGLKVKIHVLPNFVDLQGFDSQYGSGEKVICYFGRLSAEKGLFTLVGAMKGMRLKLKIIGEGPIEKALRLKTRNEKIDNVEFIGYKKGEELKREIKTSIAVVLPSECYENNPRSVLEAFALGKPVVGARIGGIPELVKDGETGFTFEAGNIEDLRDRILALANDSDRIVQMGKNARKLVEEDFNSQGHYDRLINIYRTVSQAS